MNKARDNSSGFARDHEVGPVEGIDSSGFVSSGESEHALLSSGKISVEEFMDMSVDRALAHLTGQISTDRLNLMRGVLRAQLEQDPTLSALVDRASQGD